MKNKGLEAFRPHRAALIAAVVWTAAVAGSLLWNLEQDEQQALSLARNEALANFNKDQALRLWATGHGGVYVPATQATPPSPYMEHIAERDVITPSGRKLTLMNPNYMLRQTMEYFQEKYGVRGHITGLVLLRPENVADAWETKALKAFQRGAEEVTETTLIDGRPFLRLMRPMMMEEGCLLCHGHLGISVGEVRGGVSVAVPMAPYLEAGRKGRNALLGGHGAIWLLGLGLIAGGGAQINRRLRETLEAQRQLQQLNLELEARVAQRAAALAENEKRLNVIFSTAPDGIVTSDESGIIESANPAAVEIFGYDDPSALVGKPITLLIPSENAGRHPDYVADYIAGKAPGIIGVGREVSGLRRDGAIIPLYIAIGVARIGTRTLFTAILRDRTADKRAQAEVLAAKEQAETARRQAETANKAKSQFIAGMSHELRTPMNAVLGFAELMEQGVAGALTPKQAEYIRIMRAAGGHLNQLILDILDFSRIDAGKLSISLETVQPYEAMEETLNLLEPLSERFDVGIDNLITPDCPAIRADYVRFKQILLNLCANGVKYAGSGARVTVKADAYGDGMIRLTVADNGRGIPADKLKEIFQPFSRIGAEAGEVEGVGLGLTITKRLVEMMNGRLSVESREGAGATFFVDLAAAEGAVSPRTVSDPAQASAALQAVGGRTVLYIEDNPLNVDLMREMLGPYPNLRFVFAISAEAGLETARRDPPDLILMDINLPGMDGFAALAELQQDERLKGIPVIALSATAMPEDVQRGVRAGFLCYLVKPLEVVRTLEAISLALSR